MAWPTLVANDKGRLAPARPSGAPPISTMIDRRALLAGAAGLALASHVEAAASAESFAPLSPSIGPVEALPKGYRRTVILRWGDPLWSDSPAFDPAKADPKAAERQYGYNNDYTAILQEDPETGRRDADTLHWLASYRRGDDGQVYCGLYADVLEPGRVAVGDTVEPAGAAA